MIKEITKANQLNGLGVGTIVYFNLGILGLTKDIYDIGLLIPSNLKDSERRNIQIRFLEAVQKTYESEWLDLKELEEFYQYNWRIKPFFDYIIEGKDKGKYGILPDKDLIVCRAPVPKDKKLAEKFVFELEEMLNERV